MTGTNLTLTPLSASPFISPHPMIGFIHPFGKLEVKF
jgi:hypothetical protein